MEKWTYDNIPDLTGKVIIVTGGNSGIGFHQVKAFAQNGATVIMASRSEQKAQIARKEIMQSNPRGTVEIMLLDLADLSSVRDFARRFKEKYDRLDVLVNNAGLMAIPYSKTKDGFEMQLGVNHLGHFALTGLLLDVIKATPGSRVVNVSSNAHKMGKIDFDNLMFEKGGYTPFKAYSQSKLANLLFTYELDRRFRQYNIQSMALAAHPGGAATNLWENIKQKLWFRILQPLVYLFLQSAQMGALPVIRAAVDPQARGSQYYGPHKGNKGYPVVVESNEASHNEEDARRLWEISEQLTGIKFNFSTNN